MDDLLKRIEQIEAALVAIAMHRPISMDEHGRIVPVAGGPLCKCERCGGRGFLYQVGYNTAALPCPVCAR